MASLAEMGDGGYEKEEVELSDDFFDSETNMTMMGFVIEPLSSSSQDVIAADESFSMRIDELGVPDQLQSEGFFANQSDSLCAVISANISGIICFSNGSDVDPTSNFSSPASEVQPVSAPFGIFMTVLIAVCIGICIIITVFGNLLVLTAFVVERTIRQPSNYFICSLAVSDLIIGLISMPFYAIYVLKGTWDLGPIPCDLWLAVDHTVCLVSIYTVLLITIDRYCSVKYPTRYRSWRNKSKVLWMVTLTWIIPFLIFFISIMGWEHFIGYRDLAPGECAVQFLKDPVFNTSLILFYFYFTLCVLFVLYGGIYKIASDMAKRSEQKQRKVQSLVALGRTAAEMTARTLNQGNLDSQLQAREKRTSSHLELKEERTTRSAFEVSKAAKQKATSETGFNHSSTLDAIASSAANSDQDRSSSPVFESDEEEDEEIVKKQVNLTKTNKSAPNTSDLLKKKKKRKKSRNGQSPFAQTEPTVDRATVKPLVPRSPVIASCPGRLSMPQEFTSSVSSSSKPAEPIPELPVREVTAAATTAPSSSATSQSDHSPPLPKRPRPPSTLDIDGRRESSKRTRVSSDSSSSHSSRSARGGKFAGSNHKPKVSTTVDRSGSTRVLNKMGSPSPVDTANDGIRLKSEDVAGKEEDSEARFQNKASIVIKLSRRFRGVKVSSKEFRAKSKSENRARKALRTISFILGAFVICWTPYHILALIQGFCSTKDCVNHHLFYFTYFLCYANSPINPFCYAMANQQFKKTFYRILRGDLRHH